MTYSTACILLSVQDRNLRKIKNVRFVSGEYEYRIDYRGGFASYIAIDRRKIGKRRFEYFGGVSAAHCMSSESAMNLVMEEIQKKGAA